MPWFTAIFTVETAEKWSVNSDSHRFSRRRSSPDEIRQFINQFGEIHIFRTSGAFMSTPSHLCRNGLTTLILTVALTISSIATAHDTWVEVNSSDVRPGHVAHIDLKLGNHGNDHRDFKLAGKVSLEPCTLAVIDPMKQSHDLKGRTVDTGFTTKEGYWTARHVPTLNGLHTVWHTMQSHHGRARTVKTGKTFFVVSKSGDDVRGSLATEPLGGPIELIPLTSPVGGIQGESIRVQVLFNGQPLPKARVSFIPRSQKLAEGFDQQFERHSDLNGHAEFTPSIGDRYLIVVHHATTESGASHDSTKYVATLTMDVAEFRP
jgi:uncharacterized GH25 family protein